MRNIKYLNSILTVLCGLLVVQLWTVWTAPTATIVSAAQAAPGGGIPDPGAQQKEIIDLLKQLVQKVEEQTELFKSGQARVHVDAPPGDKPKG